jgi:hypothetical protein
MDTRVNSNAFEALLVECANSSGSSSSSDDSDAGWTPLPADAVSGRTLVAGAAPATSSDEEIEARHGSGRGRQHRPAVQRQDLGLGSYSLLFCWCAVRWQRLRAGRVQLRTDEAAAEGNRCNVARWTAGADK